MATYHVSLGFAQLPDVDLNEFTSAVIAGLTGNTALPTPPVSMADLALAQADFEAALTAAAQGGTQATAAKNGEREAVINNLRREAYYVQGAMKNELAIVQITNEVSTQLVVQLQRVANARAYEVQKMNGTGGWTAVGIFTKARRIVIENLVPGSTYSVQARAIGGSTGYSGWSDPVSHMAT